MLLNLQSSRGLGISRETNMAGCAECQVSNTVAAVVLQSRWRGDGAGLQRWRRPRKEAGWAGPRMPRMSPAEDSSGTQD